MSDEVVSTPFGKFLIPKGDLIGETLRAGTLWDGPGFLQPLAIEHGDLGKAGVTILDIGANLGQFSVWLASKGAWRVIAVEPVPETMRYLKANLDLNKDVCAERVIPAEIAAYDKICRLWAPPLDRTNTGGTVLQEAHVGDGNVLAMPLDEIRWSFGERVSLIKIDAEGCDGVAILGLAETIKRDHPAIVFEWNEDTSHPHGVSLPQLRGLLKLWGYKTWEWPSQSNNYVAVYIPPPPPPLSGDIG